MKIHPALSLKRGFTLMELMVAMAITTIIITVLVSITAMATDTWNRSRAELRASRQAKAMVDTMARDLETLVIRKSNNNVQWLSAVTPTSMPGNKMLSPNACDIVFLSGSMDRYDGDVGLAGKDLGGDVSAIGYLLEFKDPIDGVSTEYQTFVFKRLLVDPDKTFTDLLGLKMTPNDPTDDPLSDAFKSKYLADLQKTENFVCENIYQFSLTFHVVVSRTTSADGSVAAKTETLTVPITIGATPEWPMVKSLKISGSGVITDPSPTGTVTTDLTVADVTDNELKAGRVAAIEISLTVLTDSAVNLMERRTMTADQRSEFLMKNAYNYVKRIQVTSM